MVLIKMGNALAITICLELKRLIQILLEMDWKLQKNMDGIQLKLQ